MYSPLEGIARLRGVKTRRISSYDRSGGNRDSVPIEAGEDRIIADIEGAGVIRHIWMTLSCRDAMIRRNALLRMYWDGEEHPSVECPLGDFFGQGFAESYNYVALPLAAAPAGGNALNCYFPMPFSKGARITLENQSETQIRCFFFYIDYELHDAPDPEAGRFHAWWNRELTVPEFPDEEVTDPEGVHRPNRSDAANYLLCDIEGCGHLAGINYYVDNPSPVWYGEGDDMWMIDGEVWPGSLHGTGTEDLFNTAWCPNELYNHPYFGYAKVPSRAGFLGRVHMYRFFIEDPICFKRSLRGSIEHGHANCQTLDIASVAYWYQKEPHRVFPPMRPAGERGNMPEIGTREIHRWRQAWRESKGNGPLWGNE